MTDISSRLGYACICNTLRNQKPSVFTGRSLIKRTFTESLRDERALQNVYDLFTILQWNKQHNIRVFRIGSDIFPRATCPQFGYNIRDLPDFKHYAEVLKRCGDFAYRHGHKLCMHPGQYTVLASDNPNVVDNAIRDLEMHSTVADLIDPDNKLDITINIHLGRSFSDVACDKFIDAYHRLSPRLQQRLAIENDDKPSGASVDDLYYNIFESIGVPITFDFHHHLFCDGGLDSYQAFRLALCTWNNKPMECHYSQSPTADKLVRSHSTFYRDPLPSWLDNFADSIYIILECKAKEHALFDYRNQFCKEKVNA